MVKLFIAGGTLSMSVLSVELIILILAAWKFPSRVKEVGLIALMTGLVSVMTGMYQGFGAIELAGDISTVVFISGMKVALIPIIYGSLIYLLSLIIRVIQKPR